MDESIAPDLLSDLPLSIIEIILTLIPIRDAVRTSVLSSKWRYRWASIPELVFNDNCVDFLPDKDILEARLINFISHALLLHPGPIYKFKICSSVLQGCPYVDQWMLFLSRNGVRELILELGEGEWVRIPSCLFSCRYLTHLELSRYELDYPPVNFKGFPWLRTLNLQQVFMAQEAIESLISGCPLLENLTLYYCDGWDLNIYAPNLKKLCLEGEFKKICLEETPKLEVMIITLYMNPDEFQEQFEHSLGCTYAKVLGGVPNLRVLSGHVYFTKYLSIGIDQWRAQVTYNRLKLIELQQISFEDIDEILVVIRLIINSPNLQELYISGSPNTGSEIEASDLDIWKTECPADCTLKRLKTVMMSDLCGVPLEMELIRFLLGNSPVLEKMSVAPCTYVAEGRVDMLVELVRFRRASPLAEIFFIQGYQLSGICEYICGDHRLIAHSS